MADNAKTFLGTRMDGKMSEPREPFPIRESKMPEDKYKTAWEELQKRMKKHWKLYPHTNLLDIPWHMMQTIERELNIPNKEVKSVSCLKKE